MSLSAATLLTGSTVSATGGTTVTFNPTGKNISGGIEIVDINAADVRTATAIVARSQMPVYNQGTQTWSGGRRNMSIVVPIILADGNMYFPVIRMEMVYHPEMTAASKLELRKLAAQTLFRSDFTTFWDTGSRV